MSAGNGQGTTGRLFFALWPDADGAAALHRAATAVAAGGGRAMRRETLHLTLAFLGTVTAEQADLLPGVATASLAIPAFDFSLDRLGWWRHNQIVWAGTASVPAALAHLARDLQGNLAAAGFAVDRRPFAPHVTLLRKVARAPALPALPAVKWPVRELVLVSSQLSSAGPAYERIGAWPLPIG